MKKLQTLSLAFLLAFFGAFMVGCGEMQVDVQIGRYSAQTFTAVTSQSSYSLEKNGNNLTVKGTVPYSESVLGISAGNIVALKFTPSQEYTPDEETSIKTTNAQTNGWNEYDKDALEADGSVIWVTSVAKNKTVQLKIKWNKDFPEITYTLMVDNNASLQTA